MWNPPTLLTHALPASILSWSRLPSTVCLCSLLIHSIQPAALGGGIPSPLPGHPGNIFLEGEDVVIPAPDDSAIQTNGWRLLDDLQKVLREGRYPAGGNPQHEPLRLGQLPAGWYRLEFGASNATNPGWTSLAVLNRLKAPTPADSPIAVDSAPAWFAKNDPTEQKRLANLATLAGVSWIRDRLRWSEIQPSSNGLSAKSTTYDTSADAHHDAGLQILQVFHDTPAWAREEGSRGGRFAQDLRHVYRLGRELAARFKGRVAAWEPWNEANVSTFGAHTVDQMCSWQKAGWLGFKSGDPDLIVGWNASAALPTPAQTQGVLANETWPYFDTYNIHTYDWHDGYIDYWRPAREATAGRPLWITEADRGTPHLKNPPWYDQSPRLEILKAQWIAQSYACSLFAGAQRHFHFILGNYQEPNGVQFGLLRQDLTPRPAYVALATVGRQLAGAHHLGRWDPVKNLHLHAFRALADGQDRDMLVIWAEQQVDWDDRGKTTVEWHLPPFLKPLAVVDYLGRNLGTNIPSPLSSAPIFVSLAPGATANLPLERPPAPVERLGGVASPVVLQATMPDDLIQKVEDIPWSEGYACILSGTNTLDFSLQVYNFATNTIHGAVQVANKPPGWDVQLPSATLSIDPMDRKSLGGRLIIQPGTTVRDGWVTLRAACGKDGDPVVAFRVIHRP